MSVVVAIGIRVVRGVDWDWGDQDGGEGHVGTVIEIGGQGSSKNPSGTVVVIWDSGIKANYRVGYQCKDDLRVLDNAPTGVLHIHVSCDECKESGFAGIRWKCTSCRDYDLCHVCYMTDKHDTSHAFFRIDTPYSHRIRVPSRSQSSRVQAKGIYAGAKVTRGPDWQTEYGDQDGGPGQKGTVTNVGNAVDGTSGRSWVKVKWDSGITNDYRRGQDGTLDIRYASEANGELYYVDHLPKLEEYGNNVFVNGDFVTLVRTDELELALSDDEMAQLALAGLIGVIGRVIGLDEDEQEVVVNFGGEEYTFPTGFIAKTRRFEVGDTVTIISDKSELQRLQTGHGGCNNQMLGTAGKTGRVVDVDRDCAVKVVISGKSWIFNPECCVLESKAAPQNFAEAQDDEDDEEEEEEGDDEDDDEGDYDEDDDDNDSAEDDLNSVGNTLDFLMAHANLSAVNPDFDPRMLVREASLGHIDAVRAIVNRFPQQVDTQVENRTALLAACNRGHQPIVEVLLNAGAKPGISNHEGDNALHFAVYGNQPVILETLLGMSPGIKDAANKYGRTPLHASVKKQFDDCVRVLLRYNCNVNKQDVEGDTPFHDVLAKPSIVILDLLLATDRVDFELENAKGCNALHQAAVHGDHQAMAKILPMASHLVNVARLCDGYTALHLAALNGFPLTARALIDVGKANLDIPNSNFQTPLLVAVSKGQTPLIELLAEKGANLEMEDSDGDTALHISLLNWTKSQKSGGSGLMSIVVNIMFQVKPKNLDQAPRISEIYKTLGEGQVATLTWLAIACFLVGSGADLDHENRANKSPMDEVALANIRELLTMFKPKNPKPPPPAASKPRLPAVAPTAADPSSSSKCMMCTTEPIGMTFRPCGHSVACVDCSARMKQCFSCHVRIEEKVAVPRTPAVDGAAVTAASAKCSMCGDDPVGVRFTPCGHSVACIQCSERMNLCFSCHKPIARKVRLSVATRTSVRVPSSHKASISADSADGKPRKNKQGCLQQ